MASHAIFIGVDKHSDPDIRELTGARRDATALHALFKDTLPETDDTLLINEHASLSRVQQVLSETFSRTTSDDTIVVSFSGHGTRDHRLVLSDTSVSNLIGTTLPMEFLAELFKKSAARAILCILDCCFSGGAPAKVLEDSPIARSVLPLAELAGEGRVLIAASKENEPAYEFPSHRHGLLTKALIDVLQSGTDFIDVLAASGDILERVRTEATRLGVTQTPVFLGNIVGGLVLPRLRGGHLYRLAFPEYHGIRVTAEIGDLTTFKLSDVVLAEWEKRFGGGLNELQLAAINDHQILEGKSLLVVAPTSSGKTFIGELAALKAVHEGRKAVFLLPFRALVNEKYEEFQALYGERLGLRVVRCSGDYADQAGQIARGRYDLGLLTYEMFLSLSLAIPHILQSIGLVVVDEAQFITNPTRGINLELLLTNLIANRERGLAPQVIALSAVIGDVNQFHDWLGTGLLVRYDRPVPLKEGVIDRVGQYQVKDHDGSLKVEQLLPPGSIYQRKGKPESQDVIVPLVTKLIAGGEKILIFRNNKGSTQGCAQYLANELGLPPATDVLNQLPEQDLSSASAALRRCLHGGTAFHNTNLTPEEKLAVERSFREPGGKIRVLAATSTLAAGINTPADTVIIVETVFKGEQDVPYTVSDYKNMAGRAGRLGFKSEGRSILLAEHSIERQRFFSLYVLGGPEAMASSFNPSSIETWVVRLLAQVKRVPRDSVADLLVHTYGGYLATRSNPSWQAGLRSRIDQLLTRMLSLELLEERSGQVSLTLLGKACGNSPLSFPSALRLVQALRAIPPRELSPTYLMALIQGLSEADAYTPIFKKGTKDQIWPYRVASYYGDNVNYFLQEDVGSGFEYYARAKRASILWEWINGVPVEEIERGHTVNPYLAVEYGNIRGFADTTRFLLRSVANIAALIAPGESLEFDTLLNQLEFGLPSEALEMVKLPVALTRGEHLELWRREIKAPEELLALPEAELRQILTAQNFAKVVALRSKL